jgi:hypothetical protein
VIDRGAAVFDARGKHEERFHRRNLIYAGTCCNRVIPSTAQMQLAAEYNIGEVMEANEF